MQSFPPGDTNARYYYYSYFRTLQVGIPRKVSPGTQEYHSEVQLWHYIWHVLRTVMSIYPWYFENNVWHARQHSVDGIASYVSVGISLRYFLVPVEIYLIYRSRDSTGELYPRCYVVKYVLPACKCVRILREKSQYFLSAMKTNPRVGKTCFAQITHLLSIQTTPPLINAGE